jgi:hypothetical protein
MPKGCRSGYRPAGSTISNDPKSIPESEDWRPNANSADGETHAPPHEGVVEASPHPRKLIMSLTRGRSCIQAKFAARRRRQDAAPHRTNDLDRAEHRHTIINGGTPLQGIGATLPELMSLARSDIHQIGISVRQPTFPHQDMPQSASADRAFRKESARHVNRRALCGE